MFLVFFRCRIKIGKQLKYEENIKYENMLENMSFGKRKAKLVPGGIEPTPWTSNFQIQCADQLSYAASLFRN